MQGRLQVATVDPFYNRFGAYHPVFTGILVDAPQMGYIDIVVPSTFPREQLPYLSMVSHGDILSVNLPDYYSSNREFGTLVTGTALSIISLSRPQQHTTCPTCGSPMVYDNTLWCENSACRGRLLARMMYLGSPEGMRYPWIANRELSTNIINHLRLSNLSRLFSWAEVSIIEPDVLPSACREEMINSLRLFKLNYTTSPPDATAMSTMTLLNALSYPGLDSTAVSQIVQRGISQYGAIYLTDYVPLFHDQASIQTLLPGCSPMGARFLQKQLLPYMKEFRSIAEELSIV